MPTLARATPPDRRQRNGENRQNGDDDQPEHRHAGRLPTEFLANLVGGSLHPLVGDDLGDEDAASVEVFIVSANADSCEVFQEQLPIEPLPDHPLRVPITFPH